MSFLTQVPTKAWELHRQGHRDIDRDIDTAQLLLHDVNPIPAT